MIRNNPTNNLLSSSILFLAVLCLSSMGVSGAYAADIDVAKKAGFAPHRALYDIKLKETKSGSQIVNISGQMFYEWESSCDAWISNHSFNIAYEYADSPAMRITSDFSIYEPFDGKSMSFTSQRKRNGKLFEEMRGQANIDDNGSGEAVYSLPEGLSFVLPKNTQFPMSHSLKIMEQLKAGNKFYTSAIFDGSDRDGPVEVNTFIGKPVNALANIEATSNIDMSLVNVPAHHVSLAFFPLKNESEAVDYEMSIVFHDNGVISDMFIEYDDFSVSQKLVALEALDTPCDNAENQR